MAKLSTLLLGLALALCVCFPAAGQSRRAPQYNRNNQTQFYNGANQGIRGGYYGNNRSTYHDYRNRQGGIGPGKGALIGGGAGAALGALFGGGVKGALITGAAGAGIGAILGDAAQNSRNRKNYYRR